MLKNFRLKNKLSVIIKPIVGTQATTFMILVPVGSRFETDKLAGSSHFVEHLMFKGTKKRPTSLDISRELDAAGAQFNAFTGKNYTGYYIKIDSAKSDLAMDILSDMIFHSKFDEKEVMREKGVIVEEIKMYLENPVSAASLLFDRLYFGQHPLGRDIAGSKKTVKAISRNDLYLYYKSVYSPENLVLVVAGNIKKNIKEKAVKYFGAEIKNTAKKITISDYEKYKPIKQTDIEVITQKKKLNQANVIIGFPGISINHPKRYALDILLSILGEGMSSRLFVEVREKRGLAYRIKAGADYFPDCGAVTIEAGLDANRLAEAIKVIKDECKKISSEPVAKTELADAKSSIAGQLKLKMEDSSAQAVMYAMKYWFEPKLEEYLEDIKRYNKVTINDVLEIAKEVLKIKKMKIAVVGPFSTRQIKKMLK